MDQPRRINSTAVALCAVAVLLLANFLVLCVRGQYPSVLPAAYAQPRQAPIAGGAGLFVMPAQLSGNSWGCYLMDVDRGTICVYQFFPGSKQLQFIAARNFTNDVKLRDYNTTPGTSEIADLVNKQNQSIRTGVIENPTPDDQPKKNP